MSLADDLQKLETLRSSGALSEDEFKAAKAKLIQPPTETPPRIDVPKSPPEADDDALGIIMVVLGIVVILLIVFAFWHHHHYYHGPSIDR